MLFFLILLSFASNLPNNIMKRKNSTISSFFKVTIYTSEGQGKILIQKFPSGPRMKPIMHPFRTFNHPHSIIFFWYLIMFKTFVETKDFYHIQLFKLHFELLKDRSIFTHFCHLGQKLTYFEEWPPKKGPSDALVYHIIPVLSNHL